MYIYTCIYNNLAIRFLCGRAKHETLFAGNDDLGVVNGIRGCKRVWMPCDELQFNDVYTGDQQEVVRDQRRLKKMKSEDIDEWLEGVCIFGNDSQDMPPTPVKQKASASGSACVETETGDAASVTSKSGGFSPATKGGGDRKPSGKGVGDRGRQAKPWEDTIPKHEACQELNALNETVVKSIETVLERYKAVRASALCVGSSDGQEDPARLRPLSDTKMAPRQSCIDPSVVVSLMMWTMSPCKRKRHPWKCHSHPHCPILQKPIHPQNRTPRLLTEANPIHPQNLTPRLRLQR